MSINNSNEPNSEKQPSKQAHWFPAGPGATSPQPPWEWREDKFDEGARLEAVNGVIDNAVFLCTVADYYKVDSRAIAGVILWEGCENPHSVVTRQFSSTKGILGKIHPAHKEGKGKSDVAELVEEGGLVPPLTFIDSSGKEQIVKPRKQREADLLTAKLTIDNEDSIIKARIKKLQDPLWAIVYIGAIMDRQAKIYQNVKYKRSDGAMIDRVKVNKVRIMNGKPTLDNKTYSIGINIRRRLNVMTALYQGGNIEERAKNFAERRYNYLMSNSIKDSEGEPRMPPPKEEAMGWWCDGYRDWIQLQIDLGLRKNPTKKENIKKYLPKA